MCSKFVLGGLCLLAALAMPIPEAAFAGGDVAGEYKIVEDGKITWLVHVEKAPSGAGYKIRWTEKSSGEEHTGIGVQDGDIFAASSSGPWVAVYRVTAKGNLTGRSFFQGKPKWSGADTWIKIK